MRMTVDSAHGGTGWVERNNRMIEDLGLIWGEFGVVSETDELKKVLLRRPGKEVNKVDIPTNYLWTRKMDIDKAQCQHDALADIYRSHGVQVEYIDDDAANDYPNIIYVRDTFTMIPEGAIVSRLASKIRAGEECIVERKLASIGAPIIASIHSNMILEGPDIVLVNSKLAFLGVGIRTNMKAVRFVHLLLEIQGYEEIKIIQTTYGCGHLDGVVNILSPKHAVIVPQRASYELYQTLKNHGFKIIDLENQAEVDECMSINFVPLNEEAIVINKGAKETIGLYRNCGIECIEVDVSELTKGGGSVHCMSGVLQRRGR